MTVDQPHHRSLQRVRAYGAAAARVPDAARVTSPAARAARDGHPAVHRA